MPIGKRIRSTSRRVPSGMGWSARLGSILLILSLPMILTSWIPAFGAESKSARLIWLDGGPQQHETYDPKPEAPVEFRGPLKAMSTKVPGVQISELLPNHARLMDRMSIIRSMHHDNGDHFAAGHWMLTGYLGSGPGGRPVRDAHLRRLGLFPSSPSRAATPGAATERPAGRTGFGSAFWASSPLWTTRLW